MEFTNYIGIFETSGDVQTALDEGTLVKPYVAMVGTAKTLDYNTQDLTPEVDCSELATNQEKCECYGGTWNDSESDSGCEMGEQKCFQEGYDYDCQDCMECIAAGGTWEEDPNTHEWSCIYPQE